MYWLRLAATVLTLGLATATSAQEIGGGVGASWRFADGDAAVAFDLDAATGDLWSWRSVSLAIGGGGEIDTDGAIWGGAGPVVRIALTEKLRLDGSFMVGLYEEGDGVDLGGTVNFRSRIGINYAVTPEWRLGVALSHKSNAGIYDENPGVERLVAQVIYGF